MSTKVMTRDGINNVIERLLQERAPGVSYSLLPDQLLSLKNVIVEFACAALLDEYIRNGIAEWEMR